MIHGVNDEPGLFSATRYVSFSKILNLFTQNHRPKGTLLCTSRLITCPDARSECTPAMPTFLAAGTKAPSNVGTRGHARLPGQTPPEGDAPSIAQKRSFLMTG